MMNRTMSAQGGKNFLIIIFAVFLILPVVLFGQTAFAAADKAIGTACTFDTTYVCQDASKAPYTDTTKWDCQAKGECIGSGTKCCKAKPAAPGTTDCATANCKPGPCAATEPENTSKKCPGTNKCCEPKTAPPDQTGGSSVPKTGGSVQLKNPLSGVGESTAGVATVLGRIINLILGVVGSFALLMFVYGGFVMITSAGHSEAVKKGKDTLTWAIIGIAVILGSYLMVGYVISGFQGQVRPTGIPGSSTTGGTVNDDSKCTAWGGNCVNIHQCTTADGKPEVNFTICINNYQTTESSTCIQNYCSGNANNVCCKSNTSPPAATCNNNGTCNSGETTANCPADCPASAPPPTTKCQASGSYGGTNCSTHQCVAPSYCISPGTCSSNSTVNPLGTNQFYLPTTTNTGVPCSNVCVCIAR